MYYKNKIERVIYYINSNTTLHTTTILLKHSFIFDIQLCIDNPYPSR